MRAALVVARSWHEPTIRITISDEEINIAMPLPDFLQALVAEAGSPLFTLTRGQQLTALTAAADRVVTGMKAETVRVV
jgi:hypothetical protein